MAQIRTNATMPPIRLCVVRENSVSRPSSFTVVVGNLDKQLESKVVGCRFMDRQFDLLGEISDEMTPTPTCSLDTCSYTETPVANRVLRNEDGLQISVKSISTSRTSRISSCSEVKRKQSASDSSADYVKSRLDFQCKHELEIIFESTFPDQLCKKVKRDIS